MYTFLFTILQLLKKQIDFKRALDCSIFNAVSVSSGILFVIYFILCYSYISCSCYLLFFYFNFYVTFRYLISNKMCQSSSVNSSYYFRYLDKQNIVCVAINSLIFIDCRHCKRVTIIITYARSVFEKTLSKP